VIAHDNLPGARLTGPLPLDPTGEHGVARVLRTGEAEFIPELTLDIMGIAASGSGHSDCEVEQTLAGLGLASAITVPMWSEGQIIGALQVLSRRGRPGHGERDVALAHSVARGIGDALASRWLTDQHRHIATTLQRAFLPPSLPTIPGIDVAAAYWPAGAASEVGGDFYDLFAIDDHRWALLIGDACGTGSDAAATAAIARHTARAAARHGLGHIEVLEWVNQAVRHSDRDLFCTACYATLHIPPDATAIDLHLAIAGHPLPILVTADAASSLGKPGTLLGVFENPTFTVSHHRLEAATAIVFYTDGLTDLPGPAGRTDRELQEFLAGRPTGSAHDVLRRLQSDLDQRVSSPGRADDVALLVLKNAAAPL
jgi:phosphoserine phosphatase RsbU/P